MKNSVNKSPEKTKTNSVLVGIYVSRAAYVGLTQNKLHGKEVIQCNSLPR